MTEVIAISCAAASPLFAGAAASRRRRAQVTDRIYRRPDLSRNIRHLELSRLAQMCAPLLAIGGWFIAGPPGAASGLLGALLLPAWVRRRKRENARRLVDRQLSEVVRALAAAIRSGMSVPQAFAHAAEEVDEPISSSLLRLVDLHALGEPLADALSAWASATASADARFVAGVLQLHQRTGGDLPFVLDQVAKTLTERADAEREVRTLTAQARLSGAILGALPIGFFLFLSLVARSDVAAAYDSVAGAAAVIVGLILQGLAYLWIRHLLEVDR